MQHDGPASPAVCAVVKERPAELSDSNVSDDYDYSCDDDDDDDDQHKPGAADAGADTAPVQLMPEALVVNDRASAQGTAIGRVRPTVCLFSLLSF